MENTYKLDSPYFIGSGFDNYGAFHSFKIDNDIHIVYNIDTPKQFITTLSLTELKRNPDKYILTPFAFYYNN